MLVAPGEWTSVISLALSTRPAYTPHIKAECARPAAVTMLAYNKYGQDLQLTHVRLAFVTVVFVVATCIYLIKQAINQSKEAQPVEFELKEPGK